MLNDFVNNSKNKYTLLFPFIFTMENKQNENKENEYLNDKDLENAVKLKNQREKEQRVYRQWNMEFNAMKNELEKKMIEFRDKVDILDKENIEKHKEDLVLYCLNCFKQKNPIIIENIIGPIIALYGFYSIKECFLRIYPNIPTGKNHPFIVQEDLLEDILQNIIMSFDKRYDQPVSILKWKDFLYPEKYYKFDNVIPNNIHGFIIAESEKLLNELMEQDKETLDEIENKIKMNYWNSLRQGKLPRDYVVESEALWPRRTLHFIEMLDPGQEKMFEKTIDEKDFSILQEQAKKRLTAFLEESENIDNEKELEFIQNNIDHLQSIVHGNPPFGYRLLKETKTTDEDPE